MSTDLAANVKQVVPFLSVLDMERSLRFYTEGLGYSVENKWVVEGQIRWCWLTLGGASIMLQEFRTEGHDSWKPEGKVGEGMSLCFQCENAIAIFDDCIAKGIEATEPQVGNALWSTRLEDPDGYVLYFGSPTDVPEETKLSEVRGR